MNSSVWLFQWAEKELSHEISEDKMIPIRNFVFIWNIFENLCFECSATAKKINDYNRVAPSDDITKEVYFTIVRRYLNEKTGKTTEKFKGLFDEENPFQGKLEAVLRSSEPTLFEMNQVCRMVIWRYRCNVVHGNKKAYNLFEDTALFEPLCQYMMAVIDDHNTTNMP